MSSASIFRSKLSVVCLTVVASVFAASAASAQPMKEFLDALLSQVLGDKAKQLEQVTSSLTRTKSVFVGRTWDLKDAGRRPSKVSAMANEVCFESLGTVNKVCADYNGNETRRIGFVKMPNGTGENARIFVDGGRIVVESESIECTTGSKLYWATSVNLVTKNQQNSGITSAMESNGGLGGCS
jgi:hypothetical protein